MELTDRTDGGRRLVPLLSALDLSSPLVLALPRGGVPVGRAIADALDAPLDVLVARKLGVPGRPELAMGAIAEGGVAVLDDETLSVLRITPERVDAVVVSEEAELARRVETYRGDRALTNPAGRDVVLVDDGVATGMTAEAALRSLRARAPGRLVLAVPVGAPATIARLRALADDVVAVVAPDRLRSVGEWYRDFAQTTDREVLDLLGRRSS